MENNKRDAGEKSKTVKNQDVKDAPVKQSAHSHGGVGFDIDVEQPGSYRERRDEVAKEIEDDPGTFEN